MKCDFWASCTQEIGAPALIFLYTCHNFLLAAPIFVQGLWPSQMEVYHHSSQMAFQVPNCQRKKWKSLLPLKSYAHFYQAKDQGVLLSERKVCLFLE